MRNLGAKLLLILTAVATFSAATIAKTADSDNFDSYVSVGSGGDSITSSLFGSTGDSVANALVDDGSQAKCYIEWTDARRGKIRLQIKCPVRQR